MKIFPLFCHKTAEMKIFPLFYENISAVLSLNGGNENISAVLWILSFYHKKHYFYLRNLTIRPQRPLTTAFKFVMFLLGRSTRCLFSLVHALLLHKRWTKTLLKYSDSILHTGREVFKLGRSKYIDFFLFFYCRI